jgi:hypothetical protein
MTNVSQPGS